MALERVFTLDQLKPYTGTCTKSTIWGWINRGLFPQPIRVGPNSVVWSESALEKWQKEQAARPYVKQHTVGGRPLGAQNRKRRAKAKADDKPQWLRAKEAA